MNYIKSNTFPPLLFMILLLIFSSCSTQDDDKNIENVPSSITPAPSDNIMYPNQIGELITTSFEGQSVEGEKIGDHILFEGDILLNTVNDGISSKVLSAGKKGDRWKNLTVYYDIDPNLPRQDRVINAINHWKSRTYLKFVKRTNQKDYILFKKGTVCASHVGRIGGKQDIILADGCSTGSTIHEIGHAVGLYHEQSRADRDKHLNILFNNIQDKKGHNFNKYNPNVGADYTKNFDFNSIMLYSSGAFSKNGQPTITKKDGSTYNSQRNGLSNLDRAGILRMYLATSGSLTYDCGTENSPIFDNYLGLSHTSVGAAGWKSTNKLKAVDRGSISGVNNINRDLIYASVPKTFEHRVKNGNWSVTVTFGDYSFKHDRMVVKAEGVEKARITTNAREFKNATFTTNVRDGKLTLEFSDAGGSDINWAITRINMRKL